MTASLANQPFSAEQVSPPTSIELPKSAAILDLRPRLPAIPAEITLPQPTPEQQLESALFHEKFMQHVFDKSLRPLPPPGHFNRFLEYVDYTRQHRRLRANKASIDALLDQAKSAVWDATVAP